MSDIKTSSDWRPRKKEVMVGNVMLSVEELSIAKRDAIVTILFRDLEVVNLMRPIMDAWRSQKELIKALALQEKSSEEISEIVNSSPQIDLGEVMERLKTVLLGLLTKNMTLVCCVMLDTQDNLKSLNMEEKSDTALRTDELYGFEYRPKLHNYIRNKVTIRQEQAIVEAMLEVNDFVGLIKNYVTLVTGYLKVARANAEDKAGSSTS